MVKRVKSVWSLRYAGRDSGIQCQGGSRLRHPCASGSRDPIRNDGSKALGCLQHNGSVAERHRRIVSPNRFSGANAVGSAQGTNARLEPTPLTGQRAKSQRESASVCAACHDPSRPGAVGSECATYSQGRMRGIPFPTQQLRKTLIPPVVRLRRADPPRASGSDAHPSPRVQPAPMGLPAPSRGGRVAVST